MIIYVCKHIHVWIRGFTYLEIKEHNPAYVTKHVQNVCKDTLTDSILDH